MQHMLHLVLFISLVGSALLFVLYGFFDSKTKKRVSVVRALLTSCPSFCLMYAAFHRAAYFNWSRPSTWIESFKWYAGLTFTTFLVAILLLAIFCNIESMVRKSCIRKKMIKHKEDSQATVVVTQPVGIYDWRKDRQRDLERQPFDQDREKIAF